MANFVTRNVLICVVPAVVLLLSVYWFRKKKKIKPDYSSVDETALPAIKNSDVCNSEDIVCSPVGSTSDFSNSFSDASTMSSPEISQRTTSVCDETSSDNVVDDSVETLTISNHIGQLNYRISPVKEEKIVPNNISHVERENKSGCSSACDSGVSVSKSLFEENEAKEPSANHKKILADSLCNIENTSVDAVIEKCSAQNTKAADESESAISSLNQGNVSDSQEQNSVSEFDSFLETVEEPILDSKQNISLLECFQKSASKSLEDSTINLENSHDSHSSIMDENSLSSMSDECEKQTDFKYKDSPSSVLDGNSLSDESEKTDLSNEHPVDKLKSDESYSGDYVVVDSMDSNKNEQYAVKLNKNSFLVKTILTDTTENSSDNVNLPDNSQNCSVLPDSLQTLSSDDFVSVSKDDLNSDQHNNQPVQTIKEIGSNEDNSCNSSVSNSLTSEIISLESENVISSTSSTKLCNQTDEHSETVVNSFSCDIVSSSDEIINKETVKLNGSQLDSLSSTDTLTSSDAIKLTEELSQQSHSKTTDLDSNELKTTGSVPGLFVYEFELPQELCGRLIGRQGKHVKSIKERTNANVFIKRHPFDTNLKTVVVEGSRSSVHEALDIIRRKFPPSQFPTVTLIQTNMLSSHGVPLPESLQLHLPEGASCDVILSSLVSAGHFFLQQPTHPTYPSLSTLDQCMISCYTQMDTPMLPQPVEAGVICAAPVMNGWFRAQIIYVYENRTECEIKFVDYGGFSQVPISSLRQIRSDFMTLPFQASECYLANVRPVDRNAGWSSEATSVFEELAQGQILQALLVEYAEDGIPCVHLYRVQGVSSMFINRELVERGLAVWVDNGHWDPH